MGCASFPISCKKIGKTFQICSSYTSEHKSYLALGRNKPCNACGQVTSLPGSPHGAGAPQVMANLQAGHQHLNHQFMFFWSKKEEGFWGGLTQWGSLLLRGSHPMSYVSLQPHAHLEGCPASTGQNLAASASASGRLEDQWCRA